MPKPIYEQVQERLKKSLDASMAKNREYKDKISILESDLLMAETATTCKELQSSLLIQQNLNKEYTLGTVVRTIHNNVHKSKSYYMIIGANDSHYYLVAIAGKLVTRGTVYKVEKRYVYSNFYIRWKASRKL